MEFTCLSEGKGFYFPPCYILDICGFRVLFDCPMDLSSLTMFLPVPTDSFSMCNGEINSRSCQKSLDLESNVYKRRKIDKPLDESSLIRAEPRYKIIKNLLLWNVSFIDVVLISSPMGILGLPFLTRSKDFSAKVYATEVAARIGQLMMEDLVTMHKEFRQVYGPEGSGSPQWMKWEELELLPSELKEIALGKDGTELAGWMPLYSAADVKDCMQKIQTLKYAEEAFYNGTLIIKAFASGLEIGTCNWSIICPKGSIAYLSSSVFSSATAMCFDYNALQRSDVILYTDFTPCNASSISNDDDNGSATADPNQSVDTVNWEAIADDYQEMEKLDFICSCSMNSVKAGGSVLIPVGRVGIILQLLERIALCLESQNLKVPIYIVSSVAEELMAFTNVIPEWLSKQRQDRLYSGQPLFNHMELLNDKRLQLFPAIHSLKLLTNWQEPCIVFCPHWSLRLGPVVHLLRRWCRDENSILVMEEGVDASLALLPFRPMKMKVLQCSFLSGIQLQYSRPLLKTLQPRHVLFPEKLRQHIDPPKNLFSSSYYSEDETLNVPYLKENSELDIAGDLASRLHYTTLKQGNINIARLKGELAIEQGKYRLLLGTEQDVSSQIRPVVHLGRINLDTLLTELRKIALNITVEETTSADGLYKASLVHVLEPNKATIEITEAQTLISTADKNLSCQISEAISCILDCF
ncbi:cleavage and polyadenylation specificity factor 73 kDa subunit-II [Abeliophyllum distichum]|uniref:Cleavage and polyadenylation specificity factor 73 kDa subunit-II n=1 Tax=Abeliophyllum distichum TaxID=126358 RepID=A0ABD1PBV0_9LAMI